MAVTGPIFSNENVRHANVADREFHFNQIGINGR